ncbi:MAG: hypothetical protein WEF51_00855 [Chloroflexota bacterium]
MRSEPPARPSVRSGSAFDPRPRPRRRRRRVPWRILLVAGLLGTAVGVGAVWTNAFGAGDRFEGLLARIDLVLDPPPDRSIPPTVDVTPRPVATASPTPRRSIPPGATPEPTPSPTPAPVRVPVDVKIDTDPEAVFASQLTKDWCAPAGMQMVLTIHRLGDTSDAFQRKLAGRVKEWESRQDSQNGSWGPNAMVEALAAYGARGYQLQGYATRADALRGAATALSETGSPVILIAWRGAHTWVMTGFRADADPLLFPDATVSGTYILDPWFPKVSTIWGRSDGPGVFQDASEMIRNFLPWKRPEGRYPDRDGKFLILAPTIPRANR